MWVINADTGAVLDQTPATVLAQSEQERGEVEYPRTLSREQHLEAAQKVVATGETRIVHEWMQYDGAWHKLARTKSWAGDNRVLEISHDVTDLDPRAKWLACVNLQTQRLELNNGESISFAEFVVLHLILRGHIHRHIAQALDISPKTVEYRISRLKNALQVDTTEALMLKVSSSGLIYLALTALKLSEPPRTELEMYKSVPN